MRVQPVYAYFQVSLVLVVLMAMTLIAVDGDLQKLGALRSDEFKLQSNEGIDLLTGFQVLYPAFTSQVATTAVPYDGEFKVLGIGGVTPTSTSGVKFLLGFAGLEILPECADGDDNDLDGRIDLDDLGCDDPQDESESGEEVLSPQVVSSSPGSPHNIWPAQTVVFTLDAAPSHGGILTIDWFTGTSLSSLTAYAGSTQAMTNPDGTLSSSATWVGPGSDVHTSYVRAIVYEDIDQDGNFESDYEKSTTIDWTILTIGQALGQVVIANPEDLVTQETGPFIEFDPTGTYAIDSTGAQNSEDLIYIWDFGKRKVPWGYVVARQRPTCESVDRTIACDQAGDYLVLGNSLQLPVTGEQPCVCLDKIDLPYDDKYSTRLTKEHFVFYDSSVEVIDASGGVSPKAYASYSSTDECQTPLSSAIPGYDNTEACEVRLDIFPLDANGVRTGFSNSAEISYFLATGDNQLPTVRLDSPAQGQAFTEGQEITFDASNSLDPDGEDSNMLYTWDFGDGSTEVGAQITKVYGPLPNDVARQYTVHLTVADEDGGVSEADVTITINPGLKPTSEITSPTGAFPVQLGSQVGFIGTATARPGAKITEFYWDLGKRDEPWGHIENPSGQAVCRQNEGSADCFSYQSLPGHTDVGDPCSCTSEFPDPEFNIYSSLNNLKKYELTPETEQEVQFNEIFTSAEACQDHESVDTVCTVSLIVADEDSNGDVRFSTKDSVDLQIEGVIGDIFVDGELNQNDADKLFSFLVGEIDSVPSHANCDQDPSGEITINDYILLAEAVANERASCEVNAQ